MILIISKELDDGGLRHFLMAIPVLLYLEFGVGSRNVARSITAIFAAVAVALTSSH